MNPQGKVSHLVQKDCSTIGLFKASHPHFNRPGKGAFFVAKQFAFQQCFGNGRTIHPHKGLVFTGTIKMQCPGNQFLAGAGLSPDQHGGIGFGHVAYQGKDFLHSSILPHYLMKPILGGNLFPQSLHFPGQGMLFHGLLNDGNQLIIIDGLGQVIEGPQFHGLDGLFDGTIGGNNNYRNIQLQLPQALNHLDTIHPGHEVIHNDGTDGILLQDVQGRGGVPGRSYLIPFPGQIGLHYP